VKLVKASKIHLQRLVADALEVGPRLVLHLVCIDYSFRCPEVRQLGGVLVEINGVEDHNEPLLARW